MAMAVKYQLMLCPCASDILKVTYNHVHTMRKMVRSFTVLDLLDKALVMFNKVSARTARAHLRSIAGLSVTVLRTADRRRVAVRSRHDALLLPRHSHSSKHAIVVYARDCERPMR